MKSKELLRGELIKAIRSASENEALLGAFLEDLLTTKELAVVSKRWEIVRRLATGEHQRDIAEDLKIGIGTVTRGSTELRDKNGGFTKILKKMYK